MKEHCALRGISMQDCIAYKTQEAQTLPKDVETALKAGNIRAVTFFSTRTAQIFMSLAERLNLIRTLEHVYALCIADSVLKCPNINTQIWKGVYVSETPDQNGMIALNRHILTAGA
jgi:uroporphyrinogen-III synthase